MCGALGEEGTQCVFCGMNIPKSKSTSKKTLNRFADKTTISSEAFAEKISKYHSTRPFEEPGVSIVNIGSQYGLINRNGDIVVPLQYSDILICDGRWLFLCEGKEIKLIDMATWKPINWKDKVGCYNYSVLEGLNNQIIICRGYDRERKAIDYSQSSPIAESVYQPLYSVIDPTMNKIVAEGEGSIAPFLQYGFYHWIYRFQKDDTCKNDYGRIEYLPMELIKAGVGKVILKSSFISPQGDVLAEMNGVDFEETEIKHDEKGYYVIPKEMDDPYPYYSVFYNQLNHLSKSEKRRGLHRYIPNPNLDDNELAVNFAKFIKNEVKALKDLNIKKGKDKELAEQRAIAEEIREERRTRIITALIIILGVGGFLLFVALMPWPE